MPRQQDTFFAGKGPDSPRYVAKREEYRKLRRQIDDLVEKQGGANVYFAPDSPLGKLYGKLERIAEELRQIDYSEQPSSESVKGELRQSPFADLNPTDFPKGSRK